MRKFKITAAGEKHFKSLIKDFIKNGFEMTIQSSKTAVMIKENEYVIIEY